jgi:maltooligosyltrehalose trehalohydrolase
MTHYTNAGHCLFKVWAPEKKRMIVHIVSPPGKEVEMHKDQEGYFSIEVADLRSPVRYYFKPDGEKDCPDPASQYQPEGVHGPSEVVDHTRFQWHDQSWKGLPFNSLILYELHVGTFTPEGTFEAIISKLDHLVQTGINAIELMPVSQFPGNRNWGYDGTFPYAVQNSYGGPDGLKHLVDACHQKGIAVFLDVVYNHLGPEGNHVSAFGPYFTGKYHTPWGTAINFDGPWCDGVREFFSNNPLFWFEQYHLDGLRIDAIHMVYDMSAIHFWQLTSNKVKQLEEKLQRPLYIVAESDLNSPQVTQSTAQYGWGFTAQWLDDFHHALYVLLDPAGKKRYYDFGAMQQLAKAYTEGFVHSGEFVQFRKKKFGVSSAGVPGDQFVVFNLNHDQVGNRVGGERLCMLVDYEKVKLGAAAIMLAPYVPFLFMGEEYADDTPFFYFVSHSDQELIKAVQKGRQEEFKDFGFTMPPPDPQAEKTFLDSKLTWEKRHEPQHRLILEWHAALIRLRQTNPVLQNFNKKDIQAQILGEDGLVLLRQTADEQQRMICLFNFSSGKLSWEVPAWFGEGQKILDSSAKKWILENSKIDELLPAVIKAGQSLTLLPTSVVVYYKQSL